MTGSDLQKPDIIVHFSNLILLHFCNLHTYVYVLAKFFSFIFQELLKLQPYKVAVTERSICTVSIEKNKLHVFTKTHTTYKRSDAQT